MSEDDNDHAFTPDPAPSRRNRLRRAMLLALTAVVIVYVVSGLVRRHFGSGTQHRFQVMNTFATVTVPREGRSGLSPAELAQLAEQAVREIDELMSPFGERSDIRRLNETPAGTWVEVHPHTWNVVMEALRWHRLSGGAFDPTVGALKRLFVFDQSEADSWPSSELLAEARERTGAEKLRFDREGMRLAWTVDGMRLDLGAIAKGYAADQAALALLQNGVGSALVEVGGELRVLGQKPSGPSAPWRVGIQDPRNSDPLETLEFTASQFPSTGGGNMGVATSGDYERFFVYDGKRYEHIIDPRLGEPITGGAASVTVLYPQSCLAADALATTLCVLGPDEGRSFLKSQALGLFNGGVRVVMLLPAEKRLRRLEFRIDEKGGFFESESFLE